MHSVQFVQTAKWILAVAGKCCSELFESESFTRMMHRRENPGTERAAASVLEATHEFARLQPVLSSHPFAAEVLKAFGLESILDPSWPLKIAQIPFVPEVTAELHEAMMERRRRWFQFKASVGPIETLLTPPEIASESDFDEILTIEWRGATGAKLSAELIARVLEESNELYRAVANSLGMQNIEPLQLVYASSGSMRFDFRGLGEPIKQMKEVFVEIWRRIRHRKAEDLVENSKAALEGLKVLHAIESLQQSNSITSEEAGRLRHQVVNSTLQIFQRGAVPREIPAVEAVPNQQLIETHAVKLLAAPVVAPEFDFCTLSGQDHCVFQELLEFSRPWAGDGQ